MSEEEIIQKRLPGDGILLAKMLSTDDKKICRANALQMIRRKKSKRHNEAIEKLRKIIENRELLISS